MLPILILSPFFIASGASSLEGLWQQDCQQGHRKTEQFHLNQSTLREDSFKETNCQSPLLRFESQGFFITAGKNIDFQFSEVGLTLEDQDIVADFNQRQVCGEKNWTLGQAENITGKKCELFGTGSEIQIPQKGDRRYGIFKVEEKKLSFGKLDKNHSALSPETRPVQWDPETYKQFSP